MLMATATLGMLAPQFELFGNYTAVCGPCACGGPYEPSIRAAENASTPDSVFLGQHRSSANCAAACGRVDACVAFTWFSPEGDGWRGGCHGIVNTSYSGWWSPYSMGNGCLGAVSGIRTTPCVDDEGCALNGECQRSSGRCLCDQGWEGFDCSRLALRPTTPTAGFNTPSMDGATERAANSSWGGSIVPEEDGSFLMFAAVLDQHCGISAWEPTSLIARARSTTVLGPYAFEEVIVGNFAHEPVCARAGGIANGSGPMLLFHIGRGNSTARFSNCSQCMGGRTPDPPGNCSDLPPQHLPFNPPIRVSFADSWTAAAAEWQEVPGDLWAGDENPSPFVFANGSVIMLGRDELFTASRWNGTTKYTMNQSHLFPDSQVNSCGDVQCHGIEDPSNIWQDRRGNLHAVWHDHMMIGGHSYSRDGMRWHYSRNPCFGPEFQVQHGSGAGSRVGGSGVRSYRLARRERPHVVIDESPAGRRRPIAMSSGVQPQGGEVPEWCHGCGSDRTYTLVVPIG